MPRLKRKQRRDIYFKALSYLKGRKCPYNNLTFEPEWPTKNSGLCELISIAIHNNPRRDICGMKEFFLFEPLTKEEWDGSFWWPEKDRHVREICLLLCIAMTYK